MSAKEYYLKLQAGYFPEVSEKPINGAIHVIEKTAFDAAIEVLEKIADPRKRDHKEPDAYTQLGCVMHMAQEFLDLLKESK